VRTPDVVGDPERSLDSVAFDTGTIEACGFKMQHVYCYDP